MFRKGKGKPEISIPFSDFQQNQDDEESFGDVSCVHDPIEGIFVILASRKSAEIYTHEISYVEIKIDEDPFKLTKLGRHIQFCNKSV